MNELKIFENPEFGTIHTVEIDGEPWMVGKDVATALGYSNPRDALAKHVDDDDKNTVAICDGTPGNPNLTIINESGLYSLVFGSRKPEAKVFKRWVTHEVIPSIRRHGVYATAETAERLMNDPDFMIRTFTALKEEREKRMALERQVELNKPKVEFANTVYETKSKRHRVLIAWSLNTMAKLLTIFALISTYNSVITITTLL